MSWQTESPWYMAAYVPGTLVSEDNEAICSASLFKSTVWILRLIVYAFGYRGMEEERIQTSKWYPQASLWHLSSYTIYSSPSFQADLLLHCHTSLLGHSVFKNIKHLRAMYLLACSPIWSTHCLPHFRSCLACQAELKPSTSQSPPWPL